MPDVVAYFDASGNAGPVGTAEDWSAFGDWADDLPVPDYEEVVHLWEQGWQDDLLALETELKKALRESKPGGAALATAAELVDLLEGRAEADGALAVTLEE